MITRGLNMLKEKIPATDIKTSMPSAELGAYQIQNSTKEEKHLEFAHERLLIHFLFGLQGEIKLATKDNNEAVVLTTDKYYMFSNPYVDDTLEIVLPPETSMLSIILSIKELHSIFGSSFGRDEQAVNEFMESYKMKSFFTARDMTPSISVITHQFFNGVNRPDVQKIFQQGKVMEFLSLYMDSPHTSEELKDQCPFMMDAMEMNKIKEARNIIIENMIDPPSLKSLAKMVGTNEFKLKAGFRFVFGNSVYGYLFDYRMEEAKKMLVVEKARINEVAAKVGYSNPSHFIAAYKRKYGVTPKQHLKSLV